MKENINAPLVNLIDSTLRESKDRIDSINDFAETILEKYSVLLEKKSDGLGAFGNEAKEELLLAIHDIIKKKMYGFYDLNEYRDFLTKNNA